MQAQLQVHQPQQQNQVNQVVSTLIELFKYGNHNVRVVGDAQDPWFVAKDVCAVLELSDVSVALGRLEDEWKSFAIIPTRGGDQKMWIINESGLYDLIATSRKDEAKVFKKWVFGEVLPKIRKTGSYNAEPEPQPQPILSAAELILAQAQQLVAQEKIIREHEERLAKLEAARLNAQQELLALPPASAEVPEETIDMKLRRMVGSYCGYTGISFKEVHESLQQQFQLRYHRRIKPIVTTGPRGGTIKESFLQACVRLGCAQDYYDLAYELLCRSEEGTYNTSFLKCSSPWL